MQKKQNNAIRLGAATALTFSALAVSLAPLWPAQAAGLSCVWTGAGADTNISTAANWSDCNSGAPGADDNIVLPNGPTVQTVNNDLTGVTFTSVNAADGYTIDGNAFTVEGNMVLGSSVTVNAPVTLGVGATSDNLLSVGSSTSVSQPLTLNTGNFGISVATGSTFTLPATSGSADTVKTLGDGTVVAGNSTFTSSSGVQVLAGTWQCQTGSCFGAAANNVLVTGSAEGSSIVLNTNDTVQNNIAMASSGSDNPSLNIADGATPTLSGDLVLTGNPALQVGTGSVWTSTGNWQLGSAQATVTGVASSSRLNLHGVVQGNADAKLTLKSGVYEMDGSSPNTYSGLVTVDSNGALQLLKDGAIAGDVRLTGDSLLSSDDTSTGTPALTNTIADTSVITLATTASQFTANNNETIGGLSGTGQVTATNGLVLNVTEELTHSGDMSVGQFVKNGEGTQVMGGDITATQIQLNDGTLALNGIVTTSSFTVAEGSTLEGTGALQVTNLVLSGVLAPGLSPGRLSVVGNLDLSSGTYEVELNGTTAGTEYDQAAVTGTATLGGTLTILPGFTPAAGDVFNILQATTISGTFSGLDDGDTITASGVNYRINYNLSGSSEDTVTLTVIAVNDEGTLANTGDSMWTVAALAGSFALASSFILFRSYALFGARR